MIFPSPYPAGFLTFVGCANTFVLYNCSKDYHNSIKKFLFSKINTTPVVPIQGLK
uniref:Uncharacterized protein n=1 Tax=Meloidogyne enterolobii TaxID=390850 RepID=A0A6V7X2Q4_MELEN|nr:unnamed protein product [Meloidogyne enterolobii]